MAAANSKGTGTRSRIYNIDLLKEYGKRKRLDGAIFITLDAEAAKEIEATGKDVIRLRNRDEINEFAREAERCAPHCPLVLMLNCPADEEDTGSQKPEELKEMEALADELEAREIFYWGPVDPKEWRAVEDWTRYDKEEDVRKNLADIQDKALNANRKWSDERAAALAADAVAEDVDDFIDKTIEGKGTPPTPTGWDTLDEKLDGGLYPGLYSVGAISALGKTTFVLQMADQIAAKGERDVLIFSLEMDKRELMAKSISRYTYRLDREHGENAKTTRGILSGKFAPEDPRRGKEIELLRRAAEEYKKAAVNIHVVEGVGDIGIEEIRARVAKHTRYNGSAPVVIVDYMQILAPADVRATDKQNTDKAILELKRLSRDFETPVIAISSFNRDNYTAPVNLASFKESGAIEYSADVLIGLQYEGMEYQEGEADGARQKRIRELMKDMKIKARNYRSPQKVELCILKNRNGETTNIVFEEIPMFNYFRDTGKLDETYEPAPTYEWN